MKKILSLVLSIAVFVISTQAVFAAGDSTCATVYGGGEVCRDEVKFTINKLVQKPGKGGEFVENLTMNDAKYAPDSNINFKIVVQNTGKKEIKNLNIVDRFPQYLTFVAGAGATNAGASQINFTIGTLGAGQKVEYVITTKSGKDSDLPNTVTCVTNEIAATATDGSTANDDSQVCIEKKVLGTTPKVEEKPKVTNIPSTGPEMIALFGLAPLGALGFYLRKRA